MIRAPRTLYSGIKYLCAQVRDLPEEMAQASRAAKNDKMQSMFSGLLDKLRFAVEVEGDVPPKGAVLVANHLSYLDPLLLGSLVACRPIGKAEVMGWPVLGKAGKACGIIFVDRNDMWNRAHALRRSLDTLRDGHRVLNFPEGTTTVGDRVLPFYRGIFGAAIIANAPVVPVALQMPKTLTWTGSQTLLPHLVKLAARRANNVRVRFGMPLAPRNYRSATSLAEATRTEIADMLGLGVAVRQVS